MLPILTLPRHVAATEPHFLLDYVSIFVLKQLRNSGGKLLCDAAHQSRARLASVPSTRYVGAPIQFNRAIRPIGQHHQAHHVHGAAGCIAMRLQRRPVRFFEF